jgi:L-alanine-DL-glutamate epimerase-like enolase superfamily enzyme
MRRPFMRETWVEPDQLKRTKNYQADGLAAPGAFARTWTSADGKSTFEGELIGYAAATGQVTLERDGRRITYRRELLSAADIAFLDAQAKAAPQPMPPIAGNWKPIPRAARERNGCSVSSRGKHGRNRISW